MEGDDGDADVEVQSSLRDSLGAGTFYGVPVPQHRGLSDFFSIEFSTARNIDGREEERDHRRMRNGRREITFDEISIFFDVPITVAAKELKIGLKQLKTKCRELGIPRWPHMKLKTLKTLIRNLEDLGQREWKAEEELARQAVETLKKIKRAMERMPAAEIHEAIRKLRQSCYKAISRRRKMQRQRASSS